MLGGSGHPETGHESEMRLAPGVSFTLVVYVGVKLTVHLQIIGSGVRLTFHHFK